MVAEAEQGQSTKMSCPFIDWEAEESKEEDYKRDDNSILVPWQQNGVNLFSTVAAVSLSMETK